MTRIAVASGKGGTGKTTVAVGLARLLSASGAVHVLDCDVEAPNAALFLNPVFEVPEAVSRMAPVLDAPACNGCGRCSQVCRFHAIAAAGRSVLIFPEMCHGCGGCVLACPRGALSESSRPVGQIREGSAAGLRLTEATLHPGDTATVHLIRAVRRRESAAPWVILDCPPGTSCPVVAAVEGADLVLLVTEPTPFGLNDLRLAVEMTGQLGLRAAVVINRDGSGDGGVGRFCAEAGLPVLGRIPDRRAIAEAYSRGDLALERLPDLAAALGELAANVAREVRA